MLRKLNAVVSIHVIRETSVVDSVMCALYQDSMRAQSKTGNLDTRNRRNSFKMAGFLYTIRPLLSHGETEVIHV